MAEYKVFGSELPPTATIGVLTEGLGYALRPVDNAAQAAIISAPRLIFDAEDLTDQIPTGIGAVTQMAFGPAQSLPEASVDANGTVTANIAATFNIVLDFALARTSNPQSSLTVFRFTVNGVQVSTPLAFRLDDSQTNLHFQYEANIAAQVGDEYRMEFYRDSGGINDGLLQSVTTSLWGTSASAGLRMSVYEAQA